MVCHCLIGLWKIGCLVATTVAGSFLGELIDDPFECSSKAPRSCDKGSIHLVMQFVPSSLTTSSKSSIPHGQAAVCIVSNTCPQPKHKLQQSIFLATEIHTKRPKSLNLTSLLLKPLNDVHH